MVTALEPFAEPRRLGMIGSSECKNFTFNFVLELCELAWLTFLFSRCPYFVRNLRFGTEEICPSKTEGGKACCNTRSGFWEGMFLN